MLADFAAVVGALAGGVYLIASLLLVACVANGYVLLRNYEFAARKRLTPKSASAK